MAVKHKRMGSGPGSEALEELNEDLRETLEIVQKEAAFRGQMEGPSLTRADLAKTFPAVNDYGPKDLSGGAPDLVRLN